MCRISQMVMRIVPDANRVLSASQKALKSAAQFTLIMDVRDGRLQRCHGQSCQKTPDPTHYCIIFSQAVDGNPGKLGFPQV